MQIVAESVTLSCDLGFFHSLDSLIIQFFGVSALRYIILCKIQTESDRIPCKNIRSVLNQERCHRQRILFYFFTVQEQKNRKKDHIAKQLHSTYISDVEIYEADQSLSDPRIITRVERETVGSDDKLMRIIAKIKSDSENSSDKL